MNNFQLSIFGMLFVNFDGQFSFILAHPGGSGHQKSIPDGLMDLRAQNESSRACLGPNFRSREV